LPRQDGRENNQLRPIRIEAGFQEFAEGSALIEIGNTKVICAASVEERVPMFLKGAGKGWITAEYGMLPRSTLTRTNRQRSASGGRTHEIQRLIGRSLRSIADLPKLGERTVTIDCDVIQADGGTRTAAITGAYVALYQALLSMVRQRAMLKVPLLHSVVATSVGLVNGEPMLDLCYSEDYKASVDFNVVMSDAGEFIELQATGEEKPFSRDAMNELLDLAIGGMSELAEAQRVAISSL
jgi:ribonuclease PH